MTRRGADGNAADAVSLSEVAALLLAVDGPGLGGMVLDHPLHDVARQFAAAVHRLLPDGAPLRRLPVGVSADRLIGGIDLAATLHRGRLVAERGVLAAADGGVLVVPMSERATVAVRTTLAEALDHGAVQVARDGVAARHDARLVTLLLDESVDDEFVHPSLVDRLAFRMALDPTDIDALTQRLEVDGADKSGTSLRARVRDARQRTPMVSLDNAWLDALGNTAEMFGVYSVRATLFAVRCARAHAALQGRLVVNADDAELAARLVLAPRATRVPDLPPPEDATEPPPNEPPPSSSEPRDADEDDSSPEPPKDGGELLRDAVAAALPPGLLAQLLERANAGTMSGRVGAEEQNLMRGRPRGARGGLPRGGARLHLLETLRAAAPWQRVRQREAPREAARDAAREATRARVAVRREDFRIRRFIEKTGTTVHFVVDASGSAAVYRLGEAKGAVELLLAESYARRDRVSLMAFRGSSTEVLLPPTRALARARKVLAALPGGGGTPVATAIDAAAQQAIATRRGGSAPLVVVLSDGRANIARDGTPGRGQAEKDAMQSARQFAALNIPSMFVDTSPRGEPLARKLADAMHARYVFLPTADAKALGGLVRTAIQLADGGASRP